MTLLSFVLALFLASGIRLWSDRHRDDCAPYLAGDKTAPASEYVQTGTRTIVVPCNDWLDRQPLRIQILSLLELLLVVMFLVNGMLDTRAWLESRRRRRF
jgi:hypothetical protein